MISDKIKNDSQTKEIVARCTGAKSTNKLLYAPTKYAGAETTANIPHALIRASSIACS